MLRPPSFVYMGNVRTSGGPITNNEGDMVELTSLAVSFPFDAVYRRINLG